MKSNTYKYGTSVIWMILIDISVIFAANVNSFSVLGNSKTEKNSNLTLGCYIVSWGTGDSITVSLDNNNLVSCIPSQCFKSSSGRYIYTTNGSSIFVNINPLTRGEDDGTWKCFTSGTGVNLQFLIYTSPMGIQFRDAPQQSQDLSSNNVNLICVTVGCTRPAPSFSFYYKESSGSRQSYPTPGVSSSEKGSCTDSEMIYKSTLSLPRNTPFPHSVGTDKTVKFQCGITFPTLTHPMFTQESSNIRFAVQVASVTLYNGAATPSSGQQIQVDSGVEKTLTCISGTSRPTSTIVWYIGAVKRTATGSSFRFTPTTNDHDKSVYCKAYNIQPESQAVSSNAPRIYVRIQVTNVTLYNGTFTPSSGQQIYVNSGVEKTLTCTSGTSRPAATIVWYIGGVKQTHTGTSFSFTPTNNDHDKTVYCKAYNIQPESQAVYSNTPKLNVTVYATTPILSNETSGNLVLLSGDEVKLVCTTSATRPKAAVTWTKGTTAFGTVQNTENTVSDGLVSVTSVLTFIPLPSDDNKIVRCETMVSGQRDRPSVQQNITVWWEPSSATVQPSSPFPWLENQTARYVLCSSSDYGNPSSSVHWTSLYGTPDGVNRRISFQELSYVYNNRSVTCELSNGYTRMKHVRVISPTIHLDVKLVPKILPVQVTFVSAKGDSLNVSIPFYSYPSADDVVFTKQGGGLIQDDDRLTVSYPPAQILTQYYGQDVTLDGNTAILQIANVQEEDFVNYTLTVRNILGTKTQMFSLISQKVPLTPENIRIEHIGVTTAILSWAQAFTGEFNHTDVIQISKDLKTWTDYVSIYSGKENNSTDAKAKLERLNESTHYFVRMFAYNAIGESPVTEVEYFTTLKHQKEAVRSETLSGAAIGGIVTSCLALICFVIIVILARIYKVHCEIVKRRGTPDAVVSGSVPTSGRNHSSTLDPATLYNTLDLSDMTSQYSALADRNITGDAYDSLDTRESTVTVPTSKLYENLQV